MPPSLTSVQARQVNVEADGRTRPVAADEAAALAALHDGALRYADLRLKEIADWLAAAGRWEQTLLIVTASCGEDLGDAGTIGGPPSLHDTGLHVPLVLRCPNRIPVGIRVQELAQSIDLMPTVAALPAASSTQPVQGRALLTASGATAGPHRGRRRGLSRRRHERSPQGDPDAARKVRLAAPTKPTRCTIWRATRTSVATWPRASPSAPIVCAACCSTGWPTASDGRPSMRCRSPSRASGRPSSGKARASSESRKPRAARPPVAWG